jgi:hypothetical protein
MRCAGIDHLYSSAFVIRRISCVCACVSVSVCVSTCVCDDENVCTYRALPPKLIFYLIERISFVSNYDLYEHICRFYSAPVYRKRQTLLQNALFVLPKLFFSPSCKTKLLLKYSRNNNWWDSSYVDRAQWWHGVDEDAVLFVMLILR